MKDKFDSGILNSSETLKKGYSIVISNIGKTVALITLAISALVSFTDIAFCDFETKSFTTTLIMLLSASYIMYFSLEDAGEKLGRDSDEYKAELERYNTARNSINADMMPALREFCLEYRNAELEYRRSNLLMSEGYTESDYNAYKSGTVMSKKEERCMRRAGRMKPAELTAASLMRVNERLHADELKNPASGKLLSTLMRLIPSTVCMFFTVSVMVSAKENMDAMAVIEGILKLSALPIMGLKGYTAGYEYSHTRETEWIKTKTGLLESFLRTSAARANAN